MATLSGVAKLSNGDPAQEVLVLNRISGKYFRLTPDASGAYSVTKILNGEWLVTGLGPAGYRPQSHLVLVNGLTFEDQVLQDAPFAWWKLDEDAPATLALDYSGNSRNMSISVPDAKVLQPGLIDDGGTCMLFDGTSSLSNSGWTYAFAGNSTLSLAAVVKRPAGAAMQVIHNGNFSVGNGQGQTLQVSSAGAISTQIFASGNWRSANTADGVVPADTPCLIGWAHDPVADTISFYKNGTLVTAVPYTFGLGGGASGAWAVGMITGAGAYSNGYIDHCLVFPQALPAARWLAHAQAAGLAA